MADSAALMSISDPVHFVLIRSEPTGENHIVSSHYFEWRPVLAAPLNKCSMSIELSGIGEIMRYPQFFSIAECLYILEPSLLFRKRK